MQLALSNLKAEHLDTVLGRTWLILNPLLLAAVYFLLIRIVGGSDKASREFFSLLVGGLFLFFFTRNSLGYGANSIIRGGGLILNSAFPRAVLPISAVLSAVFSFLASIPVFLVIHIALGQPITRSLWGLPILVMVLTVFNLGIALLAAMATVYVRDLRQLIRYINRIWIYTTPVLYRFDDIPPGVATVLKFNPLYPAFAFAQRSMGGDGLDWGYLSWATVIAVAVLAIGGALFLSRESEYGVYI